MSALTAYNFPGNVRELENLIERAVTLSSDTSISVDALPELRTMGTRGARAVADLPLEGLDLEREVESFERAIILRALERTSGNRTEAARLLGISFRSMRYRLSKLGIAGSDDGPGGAAAGVASDADADGERQGARATAAPRTVRRRSRRDARCFRAAPGPSRR